jgi:hypothetical protein
LIAYSNGSESGIYLNDRGTNFIKADLRLGFAREASFADFNQDGSLDLLVHGYSQFDIYTNGAASPRLPGAPMNATAISKPPREAQFSWAPPDASAGFTYNIRIGTTPGGVEVVSPHADVTTGLRRIAEWATRVRGVCIDWDCFRRAPTIGASSPLTRPWAARPSPKSRFLCTLRCPYFSSSWQRTLPLSTVTLSVELNPGGLPTEYHFEYGPNPDQLLKMQVQQLAGSSEYLRVSEELSGLQERTTYLFRVVAQNAHGTNQLFGTFATQQFLARTFQSSVTNGLALSPGDFDGDGRMDFLGQNPDGHAVTVFWNSGSGFESIGHALD